VNRPRQCGAAEAPATRRWYRRVKPCQTAGSPVHEPGDDDGVSLDPQRGIETLETMLFIEAVYRRYFGEDPADASPGRPAKLQSSRSIRSVSGDG
jgi:hypothetical protein